MKKAQWAMMIASILALVIILTVLSCFYIGENKEIMKYSARRAWVYPERPKILSRKDAKFIEENIRYSKEVKAAIKGFGIIIELVNESDTVTILTYPEFNYFIHQNNIYKCRDTILPRELSQFFLEGND
jgi:hypothetical protein